MDLQQRIHQLLEKYNTEKYEENNPSFYVYKKRKSDGKSVLSTQVSLTLIDAIDEICKTSGFTKTSVIERLIYIGLNNAKFAINNKADLSNNERI